MLAGRTVGLSRNGGHAVVALGNRLLVIDAKLPSAAVTCDVGPVADIATVGDEIWVAAGQPLALHRFTASGAPVTAPLALWGQAGVLRAVASGAAGALWSAPPQAMLATDRGAVQIPGEPDCVVPVSLGRWIVCARDRVTLRDLGTQRWSVAGAISGGRVVDGAALLEGRTAALTVAQRDGHPGQLVVVGLRDGATHHRIALSGVDLVRFAPARGFALLRSGPRTIVILDLRFGRVLKEHAEDRDVVDMAVDDAGQTFILRYGDSQDDVALGSVLALLRAPGRISVSVGEPVGEPPASVEPAPAVIEAPLAPGDFHRGHAPLGPVAALLPRPEIIGFTTAQAQALLERYRELVAAQVGRAIAIAWDDGRLGFPNEAALPFYGEVIGILGRSTGRAREEIVAADKRVAQASAAVRAAEAFAGPSRSPLAALASEFGLSPLARSLLLLIAGPSLWGELARLYGILGNDVSRPLIDEALIARILSGEVSRYDIARELERDAPLIRHGLVRCGDGRMRPFLALTCEPVVLRLLQAADGSVGVDDIQIVPSTCSFDDLLIPAAAKDAIVRAVSAASAPARIVVRGRGGAGRHTLLATLAASANRRLGVIDAAALMRDPRDRVERIGAALRRAHLLGMLPCVDGLAALPGEDHAARNAVAGVVDHHPGPVAIHLPWDGQANIAPGYTQIDLPALSISQRTACWQLLLNRHGLRVREPQDLADRYSVGPGTIARVCARVANALAGDRGGPDPAIDAAIEIDGAVRQHLETRLSATATRVHRLSTWARIVLPPDVQESVLELIARIKHRRTVYDVWGYDSVVTTSRGVTALFQGGPGTGKTLVASAIASELGMDLYRVDLSRVMSKWIGETEQNLAKLFDAAEDGDAIILFDEADSLFAKRTEVRTSVDRYANLEVNYLLQRFDTFEGVAILTSNFGTSIDHAFKRRLSFRLTFPFPDEDAREALWKAHIPAGVPRAGAFDFAELGRRYRLSGGYIRNAALRAAFLAAEEHSLLTQDHLERAIKAEFREIGKIAEGGLLE